MNDKRLLDNLAGFVRNAERAPQGRRRRTMIKNAMAFSLEARRRGLKTDDSRLLAVIAADHEEQDGSPDEGRWIFGRHRTAQKD